MNLFVIYIGGSHEQAFIELHDMRFVIANTIEETYPELKRTWWGIPQSLHLDSWGILKFVDGYRILIKNEPPVNTDEKLFFVNLGGYDHQQFTELHKNIFVVAENEAAAKIKATQQIQDWVLPHRDYLYEVENIVDITQKTVTNNFFIHLEKTDQREPFIFTSNYVPIGKM